MHERSWTAALCALGWMCAATVAHAQTADDWCDPCVPVAAEALAAMRGGFDIGSGLHASFGIERSVLINGQAAVMQRVWLPDLARASPEALRQLQATLAGVTVATTGMGTTVTQGIGGAAGPTVIQNTVDGQRIQSLTTLNVSSNGLQWLKSGAAQATLRDALTAPLAPR